MKLSRDKKSPWSLLQTTLIVCAVAAAAVLTVNAHHSGRRRYYTQSTKIKELYESSSENRSRGRNDLAYSQILEALELSKMVDGEMSSAQATLNLEAGYVAMNLSKNAEAKAHLMKFVSFNSNKKSKEEATNEQDAVVQHALGHLFSREHNYIAARDAYKKSLDIMTEQKDFSPDKIAMGKVNLGSTLTEVGSASEGETLMRDGIGMLRDILRHHDDTNIKANLKDSLDLLGLYYISAARWSEAKAALKEAISLCETLGGKSNPDTEFIREDLESISELRRQHASSKRIEKELGPRRRQITGE